MDLNARVDVKGRRKFSNGHCTLLPLQIFFFLILISFIYSIQNFGQIYQAVLRKMVIVMVKIKCWSRGKL